MRWVVWCAIEDENKRWLYQMHNCPPHNQFTNANATLVKTNFGATGIRFSQQRPSSGRIKWGMSEVREWNRVGKTGELVWGKWWGRYPKAN